MNELVLFSHPKFGEVRTFGTYENPLFVARDVAKALGYKNPEWAVSTHCKGVRESRTPSSGGMQSINFIPEGDVYRLIIRSKLPEAEVFQDWVCEEILPSIRKKGYYVLENKIAKLDEHLTHTNDTLLGLNQYCREKKRSREEVRKWIDDELEMRFIWASQLEKLEAENGRLSAENDIMKLKLKRLQKEGKHENVSGSDYLVEEIRLLKMHIDALNRELSALKSENRKLNERMDNGRWRYYH